MCYRSFITSTQSHMTIVENVLLIVWKASAVKLRNCQLSITRALNGKRDKETELQTLGVSREQFSYIAKSSK